MATELLETSSRVDEQDASPETQGMGGWILTDVEPDQWTTGDTTSDKRDGALKWITYDSSR